MAAAVHARATTPPEPCPSRSGPPRVTIAGLTPSYLPEKGPIAITGTVTNDSHGP